MRALSGEQQQAVSRRRGSLLLSAAAGSGKTSVLVERFVGAVREDGIAPGRILAITFTERAAGELRQRVRARLQELGERELARDAESAFISTFHSFCARLLRAHPLAAGVSPGFGILDGGWSMRLQQLAFRAAVAELLEREDARAVDLLAAYGADALRRVTLGVYAQLRSHGQLEPALPGPAPRSPGPAEARLRACIGPAQLELQAAFEGARGERLGQALERLRAASELLTGRAEARGAPALTPLVLDRLELPKAGAGALAADPCERYRDALGQLRAACADQLGARDCKLIDVLLASFRRHYEQLERRRAGLDFDELELRARQLLEDHQDVRRAWSERFELLMVDEFQDTNARQLAILQALERENLFTVGDELQSIYGFRGAEVGIFRRRRAELASHDGCLQLSGSFRARPSLIAAVNAVFGARLGEGYAPLIAMREPTADEHAQPRTELLLTDTRGWEDQTRDNGQAGDAPRQRNGARRWRAAEARLLAGRIAELVACGEQRAGEIVVLLRALGDLPVYERALQDRGLGTLAATGQFWQGQQVGDLLCYLRALANPLDELALLSTLASPLVGLSTDALTLLARAARAEEASVWETIQSAAAGRSSTVPEPEHERLARFAAHLRGERERAPWRTISELLERALRFSGYEYHVLSLQGGERRLANVHKLLELARGFEAGEGPDLRGFLEHVSDLQRLAEAAEAEGPVAVGEFDAVRLMSIHAAKGLEFPTVCIADLGRAPRSFSPPALLVEGERLGLRVSLGDGSGAIASLDYERLLEERRLAEAQEEERIIYVAMTRARERLILSGAADFARWPEPGSGGAPIAWLAPALLEQMPTFDDAAERPLRELPCRGREHVSVRCLLNIAGAPEGGAALPGEGSAPAQMQLNLQEQAEAAPSGGSQQPASGAGAAPRVAPAAWRVPERELAQEREPEPGLPSSLSYSALVELERCGYRFYLERVLGLGEQRAEAGAPAKSGLPARELGTIMHLLLERADFAREGGDWSSELASVQARVGVELSAGEREQIVRLLEGAFASPLGARLAATPKLRRELPFAYGLGPERRLVTGVLDLIAVDPRGALIVDYKSDLVAQSERLESRVQRDYGIQQLVYALAALKQGAPRVEVVHWFLRRPAEPVQADFGAGDGERLERTLMERVALLEQSGFAVADAPHRALCDGCPGRSALCSWSKAQTWRELPLGSA
jgi:ATP-dependent helicase/nuclease subunit A